MQRLPQNDNSSGNVIAGPQTLQARQRQLALKIIEILETSLSALIEENSGLYLLTEEVKESRLVAPVVAAIAHYTLELETKP